MGFVQCHSDHTCFIHHNSTSQYIVLLVYVDDIILTGCKPTSTPIDPNVKLTSKSSEFLEDPDMYQHLVGRLIYLTNTRPVLTFAVNVVSQFMHAPRIEHLDAVHHILRYLKTSPGLGLFFTVAPQSRLSYFTNTDYTGCRIDQHSTYGFYPFYGDHLIL
ncbi:uncharacterized protein LOC114297801 [Camellia sinensis]|uniref:uncharacterized protein LOC114297801 n=1 Tax=Camellia sinensis TaxID=4442 RepID=UPI0010362B02|nr:uncharacterized protein LOC114297801 [Camellia sinensis]